MSIRNGTKRTASSVPTVILALLLSVLSFQAFSQADLSDFIPRVSLEGVGTYGLEPYIRDDQTAPVAEVLTSAGGKALTFLEFLLAYRPVSGGGTQYFSYDPEDEAYKLAAEPQRGRAVINIGFWGVKPLTGGGQAAVLARPGPGKHSDVIALLKDVLKASPDYFQGRQPMADPCLVYVSLFPKEQKAYQRFRDELNRLHSMSVYLLWDRGREPDLPEVLDGIPYQVIPVERLVTESKARVMITVGGADLPLAYRVIRHKATEKTGTLRGDTLVFETFKKDKAASGSAMKVLLSKPAGYNLTWIYDEDTTAWSKGELEIDLGSAANVQLVLRKLPPFQLFYLDLSGFENKPVLVSYILDNRAADLERPFFLFVSNSRNPLSTDKRSGFDALTRKITNLQPDFPVLDWDIEAITDQLDFRQVLGRNIIQMNLFISENFNTIYLENFIKAFRDTFGQDVFQFSVYSSKKLALKRKDCQYYILENQ